MAFTLAYAFLKIVKVVSADRLPAWILLIASGVAMDLVLRVLERVRRGAIRLGRTLFIGTFAALAVFVGIGKYWLQIVDGWLWVIEGLVLLGGLTSLSFYAASIATVILGAIAVRFSSGSEEKRCRTPRYVDRSGNAGFILYSASES